jgi:hypothetical protein
MRGALMKLSTLAMFFFSAAWIMPPAYATLGEKVQSGHPDSLFTGTSSTHVSHASGYSTYASETQNSTTIKEFADNSGIVFAVGWSGQHHPDLMRLFGKHFSNFKTALAQTPRGPHRAPLEIKNSDIVVRMGGHMGAVRGFAYVPSLVPDGVSVGDLK